MANILFETKGGSSPNGKPRVYFTCHPEDFEKYFKKVCEDIFKTHDCAIYYTDDMTSEIEETYKETDLYRMNLFVIPVTFRMLSNPNRAMDLDFAYAKEKHIPVLPLMMEPSIDSIYALPDKFGELQYLSPFSTDMTAISYEEKLKKYLESVLISDELAKRVRKAFDAHIFLSYRKKDRHYANELMRLIHKYPEYRDIAIWYDEFLVPGESFKENIAKMLNDSKFFTLLVTPSLLEMVDGKPNFVMAHEYPDAKKLGIPILPTEMEKTNPRKLRSKYKRVPACVNPQNEKDFKNKLSKSLKHISDPKNNDDPKHNFLIGLAYLDGIDVEVDRERGLKLITSAAEAGLVEAMMKLYFLYDQGTSIQTNYKEALKWNIKIVEHYKKTLGDEHKDTLHALSLLASSYGKSGDYQKQLQLREKIYDIYCQTCSNHHPDTIGALACLASDYNDLGDYQKALELNQKAYELRLEILGENHPDTLTTLSNLAITYCNFGDYQKALELNKKTYDISIQTLGKEHPNTVSTLSSIAVIYGLIGNYQKELQLNEAVYELHCRIFGKEHLETATTINNLGTANSHHGNHQKALKFYQNAHEIQSKILGTNHPDTLITLNNIAMTYSELGNHQKSLELHQTLHESACKILGEYHPHTLLFLNNLAGAYNNLGDHPKALELYEKNYAIRCEIFSENHPDTLSTLNNIAMTYSDLGNHREALFQMEKIYQLSRQTLGKNHPHTITSQKNLKALQKKYPYFR